MHVPNYMIITSLPRIAKHSKILQVSSNLSINAIKRTQDFFVV